MIHIHIDATPVEVPQGITVAAALQRCGCPVTRRSVSGAARAPFCGMGVCQECRVHVDGVRRLACQTVVGDGMHIERIDNGESEA